MSRRTSNPKDDEFLCEVVFVGDTDPNDTYGSAPVVLKTSSHAYLETQFALPKRLLPPDTKVGDVLLLTVAKDAGC